MNYEDYQSSKEAIKFLVRSRDTIQESRKAIDNRVGRKANGEAQNVNHNLTDEDTVLFVAEAVEYRKHEKSCEKILGDVLKRFPIWNEWLKNIKGVGPISAGWIIAEFDIYKADTVSKLWQFSGMNPGMVIGKRRIENADGSFSFELSNELVRGDKLTKGFCAPFNKRLRAALLGVMAKGFMMSKNEYYLKYYLTYKDRLINSENMIEENSGNGKKIITTWKDSKPLHRDSAAKRYMVKMFLADLYAIWRPLHNLQVRPPYQQEKLGHIHRIAV